MADITSESILSLAEAAKSIPNRPAIRTVWRWATRGTRGVQLETVMVGGRRYTSCEAIKRFLNAINEPHRTRADGAPTAHRRQAAFRANRELDAAGV